MYGNKSPYLRRSTLDEVKKMDANFLVEQAKKAMEYEVDIFYVGTINDLAVVEQVNNNLSINAI